MFKDRLKKLEQMGAAGDNATVALLLRRSSGADTMQSAIKQLEKERGRRLHSDLVERAEKLAGSIRNMVRALFAVSP